MAMGAIGRAMSLLRLSRPSSTVINIITTTSCCNDLTREGMIQSTSSITLNDQPEFLSLLSYKFSFHIVNMKNHELIF